MISIGVDPGFEAGAAVFLHRGELVLGAVEWLLRVKRKTKPDEYEVRWLAPVGVVSEPMAHLSIVGQLVCSLACEYRRSHQSEWVVAVEQTFGKGNSLRKLAESAGLVYGPSATCAANRGEIVSDRWHVHPSTWRPAILGIPGNTPRTAAKATARKLVPHLFRGWDKLGVIGRASHALEAACIARWGWLQWQRRAA